MPPKKTKPAPKKTKPTPKKTKPVTEKTSNMKAIGALVGLTASGGALAVLVKRNNDLRKENEFLKTMLNKISESQKSSFGSFFSSRKSSSDSWIDDAIRQAVEENK